MSPIPQFQAYSDVAVVWKIYLWSLVLPDTGAPVHSVPVQRSEENQNVSTKNWTKCLNNIPHLITFLQQPGKLYL